MRNIRIITALLAGLLLTLSACAVPAVTAAPPPLPAPVAPTPPAAEAIVVPEPACPTEPTAVKLGLGPWSYAVEPVKYIFEVTPASGQGSYSISQLQVYPIEAEVGDIVTFNIMVTNTIVHPGTYNIALKLEDAIIQTQAVAINGGESKMLTFEVIAAFGKFEVVAGELTAGFRVFF